MQEAGQAGQAGFQTLYLLALNSFQHNTSSHLARIHLDLSNTIP